MTSCPHCGYPVQKNLTGFCKSCRNPLVAEVIKAPEPVKAPAPKKEKKKVKAKKAPRKPTVVELGDDATD